MSGEPRIAPAPTLAAALRRAERFPTVVRFLDRNEQETTLSYAEIAERARRAASGLAQLGVRPGERVALILPTGPEFYDGFFGAVLCGAVPVPVYPPFRLGRLEEYHRRTAEMIRSVDARLVLTNARVRRVLGPTILAARPPLGCCDVDRLPAAVGAPPVAVGEDDLAFIQFSSGTTVEPKPIALTHRQVMANVRAILGAILEAHPETPQLRHAGVCWLPLYHDMGLVGCVFVALCFPGELTLLPPEEFLAKPALWLRAISRYRATISPAPNFAYGLTVDRVTAADLEGVDLSSWRVALNGAEPVTPTVLERFAERFRPHGLRAEALTPVYGLGEATLAVTFSDLRSPFRAANFDRRALAEEGVARRASVGHPLVSLGRPLPGYALRVVDEAGVEVREEGRVGRVQVQGPSVFREYLGQPEATAQVLRDGWLDTGDLGFLLDGELYLHGRSKDMVILRGRKHAPQEIEQALDDCPGARRGCVAAVGVLAASGEGEELVVLVERGHGARPEDDGDLAARASRQISERTGLVPAGVRVLEPGTLPRTSSGKIRRAEARRLLLLGALQPPRPVTALRLLGQLIRSRWSFARAPGGRSPSEPKGTGH
ncbi:MAG TPA: fatty acyl-AMP ligase [Myxococcales bacterium]|jgi:acyl-CoA synthetase (AMP-forming)/AMP-acid ligase II